MSTVEFKKSAILRGHPEPETVRRIQEICTIRNPQYDQILRFSPSGGRYTTVPQNFFLSHRREDGIEFPRGLDITGMEPGLKQIAPPTSPIQKMGKPPKFLLTPMEIQKGFLDSLKTPGYRAQSGTFLMVAQTGTGKTIAALLAALQFGLKTLILVDRELIMTTWLRDIERAFGKMKVGIIQGTKWSIGSHFTIAMTQTLRRRKEKFAELWAEIGTLVVDECDLVPAPIFFDVVSHAPCRYRIGITATEKRKDGLHSIVHLLFGKPIFRATELITDTTVPISEVYEVRTEFEQPRGFVQRLNGVPEEHGKILAAISLDDRRNSQICERISLRLSAGRTVLVAVVRRNHAQILCQKFQTENPGQFAAADPVILLGQNDNQPGEKKILSGKSKLVFATTQLIKRGVNLPMLDCLILAGPLASETNLVQLVGRIRRANPGKVNAVIDDLIDHKSEMLLRQFRVHRVPVYRKLGVPKFQRVFYA